MQSDYIAERPLGYQQFAAGTIDAASALAIPEGCSLILIVAEAQAVRWRDDGTDPTATIGQPLAVGVEMRYTSRSPTRLKFIAQVAGAILNVTYYGQGR
jgi:hypothetical protein